jgi:hypothetical protein
MPIEAASVILESRTNSGLSGFSLFKQVNKLKGNYEPLSHSLKSSSDADYIKVLLRLTYKVRR